MLTAEKPAKRAWVPWYRLPEVPLCPDCKVPCTHCGSTTKNGTMKIQQRQCPRCKKWRPNTVPNE